MLFLYLLIDVAIALITASIARKNGYSYLSWFLMGVIFNIFGLIAILVFSSSNSEKPTPETHYRCPDCGELISKEARICKHCGCKIKVESYT